MFLSTSVKLDWVYILYFQNVSFVFFLKVLNIRTTNPALCDIGLYKSWIIQEAF